MIRLLNAHDRNNNNVILYFNKGKVAAQNKYSWHHKITWQKPCYYTLMMQKGLFNHLVTDVLSTVDVSTRNPADGSMVAVKKLLSVEGLHCFLSK